MIMEFFIAIFCGGFFILAGVVSLIVFSHDFKNNGKDKK